MTTDIHQHSRRVARILALCLALLAFFAGGAAEAQNPAPAGTNNIFYHVELDGAGGQRFIFTSPTACGALPCIPSIPLQNPMVTTINSRSFQAPTNPRIATTTTPTGPAFAVATTSAALASNVLEIVAFGGGAFPTATIAVPLTIGLPGAIPYNVLGDPAGSAFYVAEFLPPPASVMVIYKISLTSGVWGVAATTIAPPTRTPSPWVDAMAINGTNLAVAYLNGVELYNTTVLGVMPTLAAITTTPFDVGTNIATGLVNPAGGTDMLVGLRMPGFAPGHSYLAFGSTAPFAVDMGPTDPFGAGLVYGPGFHEWALSEGGTVATAPLTVATLGGVGAVGQLSAGNPLVPSSTAVAFTLFGNPEAMRRGTGDPVLMHGTNGFADFVIAAGTGSINGLGAIGVSPPLGGLVNLATNDRPLSLPASAQVMAVDGSPGLGALGTEIFTVGAGPTLTLTATNPAPGGPTCMGGLLLGGGLPPAPVAFQGFFTNDQLIFGPPLMPPLTPLPDPIPVAAIASPPPTLVPPAAGGVPAFSARQPKLSIGTNAAGIVPVLALPGTAVTIFGVTVGVIKYPFQGISYNAFGLILTEIGVL